MDKPYDLIRSAEARVPDQSGAYEMAAAVCLMRDIDPNGMRWVGTDVLRNWQWVLVESGLLSRIASVSY